MPEVTPPPIPEDLNIAIKSGKVRAPTHIISTISDDRGLINGSLYLTLCCIPEEILVGSSTFYCFHLQVKNHVMLVCQCRPLLNEVMALVMLYLFCGSSVVFLVIVRNSLRWVNSVHGEVIIF